MCLHANGRECLRSGGRRKVNDLAAGLRGLVRPYVPRGVRRALADWVWGIRNLGLPYYRVFGCQRIDGFLLPSNVRELYKIAGEVSGDGALCVEIGSWVGKSSIVIAKGLAAGDGGRLHCIDPFNAAGDERSRERYAARFGSRQPDLERLFRTNVKRFRVSDRIVVQKGYSHDLVSSWQAPIDFLFLDGDHSYEAVLRDFSDWTPFVKEGGVVAMHDVWLDRPPGEGAYHTGPAEVVTKHVLNNAGYEKVSYLDSLYVLRKNE